MKHVGRLAIILISVTVIGGCTHQVPLISHAHIGHSLTAWRGTPNEEGLFVVAEREAKIALVEAQLANRAATKSASQQHTRNIIHALNPDVRASGPGLGYGAIRALQGTNHHIKFAAEAEDASHNIIRSAADYSKIADNVLGRFQVALEVAQLASQASDSELNGLNLELEELLHQCLDGYDENSDGIIDPDETGLLQLRQKLSVMASNEKEPPYHPLGRQYLLGLVRLPNGRWAYKFDQTSGGGGY